MLIAVGGGIFLVGLAKEVFDRPRPELVPHGAIVQTSSFPSGHSMMAAVVCLSLGALVARVQPRRRLKAFAMAVAVMLTILFGSSRVCLGVHWPTDVAAGWLAGAALAVPCVLEAQLLARRGHVEAELREEEPDCRSPSSRRNGDRPAPHERLMADARIFAMIANSTLVMFDLI